MTDAKPLPDRTFEYLLNAMERAAQADNPAEHGYAAKRKAVFAHVEALSADVERLRAALVELVECKDLKERIAELHKQRPYPLAEHSEATNDYEHRQPRAWTNARAAIKDTKP